MTTAVHIRDGPHYIVCVSIADFLSKFIHRKLLSSSGFFKNSIELPTKCMHQDLSAKPVVKLVSRSVSTNSVCRT